MDFSERYSQEERAADEAGVMARRPRDPEFTILAAQGVSADGRNYVVVDYDYDETGRLSDVGRSNVDVAFVRDVIYLLMENNNFTDRSRDQLPFNVADELPGFGKRVAMSCLVLAAGVAGEDRVRGFGAGRRLPPRRSDALDQFMRSVQAQAGARRQVWQREEGHAS